MSIGLQFIVLVALSSGWKAQSADIELTELKPSPRVKANNLTCQNSIWFDFIPGATLDYAKQLIATESIEVTTAIRQWDEQTYLPIVLAKRDALSMRSGDDRTVYLLAFEHGTLIMQALAQGDTPLRCVPLQSELATQLVELFFAPAVQAKVKRIATTQKPPPLKPVRPVPTNLDEALTMLEQKLNAEWLAKIRESKDEQVMLELHFGFGTGVRNQWGLWADSPLARFFQARGVWHPDDMSGIIFTSLWRKLHELPIGLDEQAAAARHYWDLRRPPNPLPPCADGGVPASLMQLEATDRVIQMFACGAEYRAWELDAGWYAPDEKLRTRTEKLRSHGNIESAPLDPRGSENTVIRLSP